VEFTQAQVVGDTIPTGTGTKPMSKDDNQEEVSIEELIMAQMVRLDAISQLLVEKGLISEEEFYTKLTQVQAEYQNLQSS